MNDSVRIAIFGGTFDPVHLGHTALIRAVLNDFSIEKLYVVPAVISNFKNTSPGASGTDRMIMLETAIKNALKEHDMLNRVVVSDIELKRGGISYTSDTVREIKRIHKSEDRIGLVLGDDHFSMLDKWHDFEYLVDNVKFIFYKRLSEEPDFSTLKKGVEYQYLHLDKIYDENSTAIRNNFEKYKNYLDKEVVQYIYRNQLYDTVRT